MKRGNKVFALMIFGLLLGSFLVGVVSAQTWWDNTLEKWKTGQGFNELEAKVILTIIIAVILLIIFFSLKMPAFLSIVLAFLVSILFTAFITPDAIIGIFTSYDVVPMAIATILPLLVLFAMTAFAGYTGSRTLITLQLVLWGVAFLFYMGEIVIELFVGSWLGVDLISTVSLTAVQKQYWWITMLISGIITGLMTFANGWFMNLAVRWFAGVSLSASTANINKMKTGMKALKELGKETEK